MLQLLGFYAALSSALSIGMRPLGVAAWQTSCECMTGAMCAPCSTCALVSLTSQLSSDTWMVTQPFQTAPSERLWQLLGESAMLWTAWSRERYSHLPYSCLTVVLHDTHIHAHALRGDRVHNVLGMLEPKLHLQLAATIRIHRVFIESQFFCSAERCMTCTNTSLRCVTQGMPNRPVTYHDSPIHLGVMQHCQT